MYFETYIICVGYISNSTTPWKKGCRGCCSIYTALKLYRSKDTTNVMYNRSAALLEPMSIQRTENNRCNDTGYIVPALMIAY